MLEELRKIHFARFRMEMEAVDPLRLPPYKGSTFRGAFGNTFKRLVCVKRDLECASCLIQQQCVYYYVFETPMVAGAEDSRGYTFAPHPFIIEPPEETQEVYEPGASLKVGLVLVGRALNYLAHFIYAFDEMGFRGLGQGRGKAALKRVFSLGWDQEQLIYTVGEGKLHNHYPVFKGPRDGEDAWQMVRLSLRTPTRLKEGGKLVDSVGFPLLIRRLLRRISELARFHCQAELTLDYQAWITRSEQVAVASSDLQWHDWERYSHRQGTKMQMGGVVGEVCYQGDLGPFMPLLRLGEDLHVGKGTGFGLGRYQIL